MHLMMRWGNSESKLGVYSEAVVEPTRLIARIPGPRSYLGILISKTWKALVSYLIAAIGSRFPYRTH